MPNLTWQRERDPAFVCDVEGCIDETGQETQAMYRWGNLGEAIAWACSKGGQPVEYTQGIPHPNPKSHRYIASVQAIENTLRRNAARQQQRLN